jgi:TRAP transporter 4TM/12TM fusion protein
MRDFSGGWYSFAAVSAVLTCLLHYYWAGFGGPTPRIFRGLHLLMLVPMVFLLFPATKNSPRCRPSILDIIAAGISFAACAYIILNHYRLDKRFFTVSTVQWEEAVLGWVFALLAIEAVRRSISRWFALTVSVVLTYLMTCQYWPGMLNFQAFSWERAAEILYLNADDGLFGFLTGLSVELLFVYILFAGVMTLSGAGDYLVKIAVWLAGWASGGAGKVAVISSALYGTISGSTVANVYATGSFTIPLMKKCGYSSKEAAAVESVAGVGGQIMPPIMGAGAFIMAEITGVPYLTIIKVAAIPAILYYLGILSMVHFIAKRRSIIPLAKEQRPSSREVFRQAYFILPFISIIGFMIYGYSPAKSAFHTIWITLLLSFLDRRTWLNPQKLLKTAMETMVNGALIAAVLACAGMTVAVITQTGIAMSFSTMIVRASGDSLLFCLLLVFAIVSVLGTGIPTTASYIIAASVGAVALSKFGVPALSAHMFVFYYAVLSDITPPDAVTAFAAANLAQSEPMSTGIEAFLLGIAGFLVPFAFVYQPALLLKGSWIEILSALAITSLGVITLAAAKIGYFAGILSILSRLILLVGSVLMVIPIKNIQIVGILAVFTIGFLSWRNAKKFKIKSSAFSLS